MNINLTRVLDSTSILATIAVIIFGSNDAKNVIKSRNNKTKNN